MSEPLPLTAAAHRLRRPPGRPRGAVVSQAPAPHAAPPLTRENARTVAVVWLRQGPKAAPEWVPASARLVGLKAASAYVGVSTWVLRGWLAEGVLARVRLPRPGGGEMERLLFDVADLDQLITAWKDAP